MKFLHGYPDRPDTAAEPYRYRPGARIVSDIFDGKYNDPYCYQSSPLEKHYSVECACAMVSGTIDDATSKSMDELADSYDVSLKGLINGCNNENDPKFDVLWQPGYNVMSTRNGPITSVMRYLGATIGVCPTSAAAKSSDSPRTSLPPKSSSPRRKFTWDRFREWNDKQPKLEANITIASCNEPHQKWISIGLYDEQPDSPAARHAKEVAEKRAKAKAKAASLIKANNEALQEVRAAHTGLSTLLAWAETAYDRIDKLLHDKNKVMKPLNVLRDDLFLGINQHLKPVPCNQCLRAGFRVGVDKCTHVGFGQAARVR